MTGQEKLLEEIRDELRRQRIGDELWSTKDIATYIQLSVSSVEKRIINKPHFPVAIVLPTTENGGSKRWKAAEVKAFFMKHREAK